MRLSFSFTTLANYRLAWSEPIIIAFFPISVSAYIVPHIASNHHRIFSIIIDHLLFSLPTKDNVNRETKKA